MYLKYKSKLELVLTDISAQWPTLKITCNVLSIFWRKVRVIFRGGIFIIFGILRHTTNFIKFRSVFSLAWQQHDVQELCRVMFDALEHTLKNTDQVSFKNLLIKLSILKCHYLLSQSVKIRLEIVKVCLDSLVGWQMLANRTCMFLCVITSFFSLLCLHITHGNPLKRILIGA